MRTTLSLRFVSFGIAALLSACGGGSDPAGNADSGTPPAQSSGTPPAQSSGTPPAQSSGTPPSSTTPVSDKDLASFAAAWTSMTVLEAVQPLQVTAGASGACQVSGSLRYDAASGTQTLQQCRLKQFPGYVFDGTMQVGSVTSDDARSHFSASIDAPSIRIAGTDGAVQYTLNRGDIASEVTDSDSGDHYFYASHVLSFLAGQASRYDVSNAGSTSTDVVFESGIPVRYTNNLVYTTNDGTQTWQVSVTSPVREAGANRPDRGSLMIVRMGAAAALNVTFGAGNTLTLDGGEQGGTRHLTWDDTALQAALAASHR